MASAGAWVRTGSAWRLITSQFVSLGFIGIAIAVLTDTTGRHSSPPVPLTDHVIAYSVAALLLLLGLAGAWRSTRLGLRLTADGGVMIRGVTHTEKLRAAQIVEARFGRTSYGPCLYLIDRRGRPHLALGVSQAPRRRPSSAATELLARIRAATVAGPLGSADPLPELPVVAWPTTSDRPASSTLVKPTLAALRRRSLPGLLDSGVAALVVFVGFQAALPHTFPWILGALVVLFLLFAVAPLIVAAFLLTRTGRLSIALADTSLSLRVGRHWQTLDLGQLAGIGASRTVSAIGPFTFPSVLSSLILVDREGHRMNLPRLLVSEGVIAHLRDQTGSRVTVTPLAAALLSP